MSGNSRVWTCRPIALGIVLVGLCTSGCPEREDPFSAANIEKRIEAAREHLRSNNVKFEQKTYPMGTAFAVEMPKANVTDELLTNLQQVGLVSEIHAADSTFGDSHIDKMLDLRLNSWLNVFDVSGTQVTDAGLQKLATFPMLGTLNVKGSKVTEQGVKAFNDARATATNINPMFRKTKITK